MSCLDCEVDEGNEQRWEAWRNDNHCCCWNNRWRTSLSCRIESTRRKKCEGTALFQAGTSELFGMRSANFVFAVALPKHQHGRRKGLCVRLIVYLRVLGETLSMCPGLWLMFQYCPLTVGIPKLKRVDEVQSRFDSGKRTAILTCM